MDTLLNIVSDLHLEQLERPDYYDILNVKALEADYKYLILAGDITVPDRYRIDVFTQWLKPVEVQYDLIFYVLGNHEYYSGLSHENILAYLRGVSPKLIVLDRDKVELPNGLNIVGCTLWTNFADQNTSWFKYSRWQNDFRYTHGGHNFIIDRHVNDCQWLKQNIDSKSIIITHHAPFRKSLHKKWEASPINMFFVNRNLKGMLKNNPLIWVHGHTHTNFQYNMKDTLVFCNPMGYNGEKEQKQNYIIISN